MDIPDSELMAQVATGDAAAFETLYRRHADAVLRTATRRCTDPHQVADVVAETFLAVWRHAGSFEPSRGSVGQWISGIAGRKYLDALRRDRRHRRLDERLRGRFELSAEATDQLVDRIDAERASAAASSAVARLPHRQRVVFELVAVDGLSVTDAADALGMTAAAASMRLTRARRALRSDAAVSAAVPFATPGGDS